MASWLLLSLLASEDAAPVRTPKVRPAWQSRLRTTSIASAARRLGVSDWNELTQGNKIVLPPSVRAVLESRGLPFTQFQIANPEIKGKRLYTGPLDFCAAEGECYLPSWVMKQLGIAEGGTCAVATAVFPKAIFAKFQPHSSAFLDVADHYMLLMRTLEQYAALTKGSTIRVTDGRRVYDLDVLEVKAKEPKAGKVVRDDSRGRAVDTTYTELVVDFHSPKDQEKPKPRATKAEEPAVAETERKAKDEEAPEPSAASAASAAKKPVPKFKRRKAAESAPGGSDGAVSRKPRFVGTARTLGSSGDEADASATGAGTPSADARGAGAQVGAKRLGAKGAGVKKAAVARTLAPRADAKASSSAEPEDESAVARPSLLQQLLAMLVRILAWLGSTLLALFAPKEVRHDVRS